MSAGRPLVARVLGLAVVLVLAGPAHAHKAGFHKKLVFTVTRAGLEALVVMDLDGGDRAQLLRAGADANADGRLTGDEVTKLKAKLVEQATRALVAEVAGFKLQAKVKEAKLSLREDPRTRDGGLSLAVLLEWPAPEPISSGMRLTLTDEAPDRSHLEIEVHQKTLADAGPEPVFRAAPPSGQTVTVRLGALASP